jgi:hypothetical protein
MTGYKLQGSIPTIVNLPTKSEFKHYLDNHCAHMAWDLIVENHAVSSVSQYIGISTATHTDGALTTVAPFLQRTGPLSRVLGHSRYTV